MSELEKVDQEYTGEFPTYTWFGTGICHFPEEEELVHTKLCIALHKLKTKEPGVLIIRSREELDAFIETMKNCADQVWGAGK